VRAQRVRNSILQSLGESDAKTFARLFEELEPVALERGVMLVAPRSHAVSAYFVESGIVALVAQTNDGSSIEVGLVGREGMAGIGDVLGHDVLPYRLVVQLPGLAYSVPKAVIREHILSCSTLHGLLMDYSQRMLHQMAQSAVCNRFHTSVQRLSRWLLLTAERAETDRLELTHEFVAQMVGAPRSAVSQAAATLRGQGAIDYRRGVLTIKDFKRLQAAACECFQAVSQPTRAEDLPVKPTARMKPQSPGGRNRVNARAKR
jgi:CRP-like cAMP-binding protein